MPPKGKGKKKNQNWDDYDAAFDEAAAAAPAAPATDLDASAATAAAVPAAPSGPAEAVSANIDDEWPEEDTRKGKKGKKGKQPAKPAAPTDDVAEPAPAPAPVSTDANIDDEWPEEDTRKGKKGKKGKQQQQPAPAAAAQPAAAADDVAETAPVSTDANVDDEWPEEDTRKGKKGKKGKQPAAKPAALPPVDVADDEETAPAAPVATDANIDDEWPEEDTRKGKKGKKGKAKPEPTAAADTAAAATAALDAAAADDEDKKPLSKKEKEKLRKQRQKELEQQKQQEALRLLDAETAKDAKAATAAAASAGGKKGKGKPGAPIAALQAMIAAQRAAEEEAARVEAEERRREEEERKRVEEEERVREEARLLKKEQQKAKKEQLRKEGKLLTKTQQEAKRRNELKLQQLLAAGVVVPALTQGAGQDDDADQGDRPKKRVVYENKKKRRPAAVAGAAAASEPGADAAVGDFKLQKQRAKEEATAAAAAAAEAAKVAAAAAKAEAEEDEDDTKDAWDASSSEDEESAADEEVKDDWDASSESESESKAPTKAPAAAAAANGKKNATPAPTKSKPAAKAVKAESSDEDSEEDSDDDDSESGSDWDDSDSEEDEETAQERKRRIAEEERIKEAAARRAARHEAALAARSKDDLRSPVCCILGHVDTGKTKLLDKIRQTNVQEGEAGGITQQIGATYFPQDAILKKTEVLNKTDLEIKLPGLLIIDTPGHESFTNLRSRGSSLCNIAVLVVDIMHGLEPQTIESLNLLRNRKTPFIVALNKIDRIYGWAETPNGGFEASFAKQAKSVQKEYKDRLDRIKLAFSEQGLNSEVYYDNKNMSKYVSIVPTSAITGEGIPDLLYLLVHLTQSRMSEKLMYVGELEATVLEVKVIEGLGTTIDVILSNGVLNENDRIVVCGLEGAIATNVRALLTPQPLRELRVKSNYVHHKSIKAAMGIKISANGLDKAVAGSRLLVVTAEDDEEELKRDVMQDLETLMSGIDTTGRGVWVQASTLGSLEALLSFLRDMKIPVSGINIGPVHKKDVVKASVMLESAKEYAVMLCFDVKVEKEAMELAEDVGVTVFQADIIYHLYDKFTAYYKDLTEKKKADVAHVAVWPCMLKIIPGCVFNKRDPIIVGCDVIEGSLRVGTPICVQAAPSADNPERPFITIGKVTSIEMNHKPVQVVKKGQSGGGVAVKIECPSYETPKMVGRHFLEGDTLMSKITRESIDVLKENFKAEVAQEDWRLIIRLKKIMGVA